MTRNEKIKIAERINLYADEKLKNVDKQVVPISIQLDLLKPIMEEHGYQF